MPHKRKTDTTPPAKETKKNAKIPKEIAARFGTNLKRLRTGPGRINNIEWGRTGFSIQFLVRLSRILECDISDFFGNDRGLTS